MSKKHNFKKKLGRKKTFKKFLFQGFILTIFSSALALMLIILYISKDLPSVDLLKNYNANFATRIYSEDGVLLNNYASENRIFVPIDEVPEVVKQAFLSAEDANFYEHSGIDIMGIVKAAFKNAVFFATGKGQLVGASTITQQVVKNLLLSNEKTLTRKAKEMLLAMEVSKHLTKDEVFEIYLNHIYLGSGAYGVMAASLEYFGKSVKEINVAQAALLAALPKAPSDINPRRRKQRAIERRNWVIQRMAENGFISNNESIIMQNSELIVTNQPKIHKVANGVSSFSDYVKSMISGIYGSEAFFSKGYYVKTNLNYKVQTILYSAFRKGILDYDKKMGYRGDAGFLKISDSICSDLNKFIETRELTDFNLKYGVVIETSQENLKVFDENCNDVFISAQSMLWARKKPLDYKKGQIIVFDKQNQSFSQMPEVNGGAMIMNPKTGQVLAMIGDFFDRPNGFNRAVHAKRQIGSAIKPFLFSAALENGFTPSSILIDEDLKLSDEWQPRNASRDFLGSITLRVALERSRNIPTVRVAEMIGVNKIIKKFKDFDLPALEPQNDLTTALGSLVVTVERVTRAFSSFVNSGMEPKALYISKINDSEGKIIFSNDGVCENCFNEKQVPFRDFKFEGTQALEPDVAFQVLSMLEGAAQRGTSAKLSKISAFGIGAKTGTTSDYKDAWHAAVTNNLAIVVYIGNDKPKTLGEGQYGAVLALPIVLEVLEQLKSFYPITPFKAPANIEQIVVDYKTGELPSASSSRRIVENFKKTDKKPKSVMSEEILTEEDEKEFNQKINSGIY